MKEEGFCDGEPDDRRGGRRRESRYRLGLWLLVALAVALRLWYADDGLHAGRFFDERISLANVEAILETGSLRPANFWYQSLSYLPQTIVLGASEGLFEATGWEALRVRGEGGFRPSAYRISRAIMVLWGALTLVLTFRIGRRLFSPEVGLLGAFLLAAVPWHVINSVRFKPDGLLLLFTLLTFWWTLRAAERPTVGRFVLAGVGVGLALSTKLNGVEVALPLTVLALVRARRDAKALLGLAAAAATAAALYLVSNPWVAETLRALEENREIYARQAAGGGGRLEVLTRSATSLVTPFFHGALVGAAVFAGLALLVGVLVQARRGNEGTAGGLAGLPAWLFLSFPLGHTLFYAAATEHFKENHHAQVLPFTSLLAAYFLVAVVRFARRRGGTWAGRAAVALLAALLAAAAARVVAFVYRDVVPTTFEAATGALRARWTGSAPRLLCREGSPSPAEGTRVRSLGAAYVVFESLRDVPAARLDACDALLFPAVRAREPENGPYLSRIARTPPARRAVFEPSWLRSRGESLTLLVHDWRPAGAPEPVPIGRSEDFAHALLPPCEEAGAWRTLELRVPGASVADALRFVEEMRVSAADAASPRAPGWHWVGRRGRKNLFVSERLACAAGAARLEIPVESRPPAGGLPELWVRPWVRK